jgi:hypothetical protein
MWLGHLFDYEALYKAAEDNAKHYQSAKPFPHIVIDNFAEPGILEEALLYFPGPKDIEWWSYKNPLEVKLAQDNLSLLPQIFRRILWEMNAGPFVQFLEKLTGIDGLISDPNFTGGGLHQIERGGKLRIHSDFNFLAKLKLHRRVNFILYLNKDWKEEYGGHLELWNESMTDGKKILPIFNRAVCFSTTDTSYHGHPDPLNCPEGESRKSIALYYYSVDRPKNELSAPHSTIYKLRPQDEASKELEDLIAKRSKGRISDT